MKLSQKLLPDIDPGAVTLPRKEIFSLPEKVLQFGTGVLSRGIPDYFIDKANQQGIFNGRIVIVSNSPYDVHSTDLQQQDLLFTQISRGVENGKVVEERVINASISRLLHAKEQWNEVLATAANPDLQVVIADTHEVSLAPDSQDDILAHPPASFAGMLLAFLHERYKVFNGDPAKGLVIIPTELIPINGQRMEAIMLELAHINDMELAFMDWLENSNKFCHSLVDRLIPYHAFPDIRTSDPELGYEDNLQVISESFCGWFIESSDPSVKEVLSFSKAGKGIIIAEDIEVFQELKLRLLNGVHTFASGLCFMAGIETVKEAMEHPVMERYIRQLMLEEIAPAIPYYVAKDEIDAFAAQVLDRFRNPYLHHTWISICLHYSQKMKRRNVPVLMQHYQQTSAVPELMALGFAAHILFMNGKEDMGRYYGTANGKRYLIQDDNAPLYAAKWALNDVQQVVNAVLTDNELWGMNLAELPGFEEAVVNWLQALQAPDIIEAIQKLQPEKQVA
ncbi:tagaturonate reductase [Aridibaculum aurantiacum]|uniref:tagaturonate reductase n=1 Tax=Aridibaculum aurantiacum TaxID=2810307 RepID=UPI001A963B6B|nr:tagaturonate reductase [Aridibaculum aurantiacum]